MPPNPTPLTDAVIAEARTTELPEPGAPLIDIDLSETRSVKLTTAILLVLLRKNGIDVPDNTKFRIEYDALADDKEIERVTADLDANSTIIAEYVVDGKKTHAIPQRRKK